jgi:hypothetical protein
VERSSFSRSFICSAQLYLLLIALRCIFSFAFERGHPAPKTHLAARENSGQHERYRNSRDQDVAFGAKLRRLSSKEMESEDATKDANCADVGQLNFEHQCYDGNI